jgi:predicted HicB family RNase H-like nuclease
MPATKQLSTSPLRLPPDLKEWAKKQAKDEGMSLNTWIVKMIENRRAAIAAKQQ